MLKSLELCNTVRFKWRITPQRTIDAVYILIFSYLILYSLFTTLYFYHWPSPKHKQPDHYNIENLAIRPISCTFPISGQYQRVPRYICYLLLIFTVVIRNHEWLAIGAAASVMTYSGVAAIHVIILFATNNVLHPPKAKTRCESLPVPGSKDPFVACAGVIDPDVNVAVYVLSCTMLGALPMAALSTTFRRSTSKVILTFWLLLLAVSHTFQNLISTNQNMHFQICAKDKVEPLPGYNYQAPRLDQPWYDSFHSLVSASQNASLSNTVGSSTACIYSCFGTRGYVGRTTQDIGVADSTGNSGPFLKNATEDRMGGIAFWWLYTLLAFLTFVTTEKRGLLPKWVHMGVPSLETCLRAWASTFRGWQRSTKVVIPGTAFPATATSEVMTSGRCITIFTVIQFSTRLISVVVFCGTIIYNEASSGPGWSNMELEPFAAVGQWGNLAVVLLVLLAAVVRRIWGDERGERPIEEARELEDGGEGLSEVNDVNVRKSSATDLELDANLEENMETVIEDRDSRIEYAS